MKTIRILALFIAASALAAGAQGLNAPDDPAAMPAAPTAAPADSSATPAPEVQPEHNTPDRSYRAERNSIRYGNREFADSNYHRALEQYEKALQVNGASIVARYNKAVTLLKLASADNAGTANDPRAQAQVLFSNLLEDARRYNPEVAHKAYYNLGNMSYNDQNYGQAIELYKSSLRIDPDDYDCRYNLRLAQLRQEQQQQDQQDQNQDQGQDEQQQQQQQQQEQEQQQQEQQQQQPQPMTQSAQQILQSMQNKENETRQNVREVEAPSRRQPEKPW